MKVAPRDFFSYFQDLCSRTEKDAYVTVKDTQETVPIAAALPELDEPISSKEIIKAVKSPKNEKNLAAMTTLSWRSQLEQVLNMLFNSTFNSGGNWPLNWKLGIFVPIFKKRR